MLSDIAFNQPRLRNRVRGVRTQYRQLQERIDALRREFEESDDAAVDFADIRQRLAWLLTALRHQRARESDLIYEAYYEAFHTDLRRHAQLGPAAALAGLPVAGIRTVRRLGCVGARGNVCVSRRRSRFVSFDRV